MNSKHPITPYAVRLPNPGKFLYPPPLTGTSAEQLRTLPSASAGSRSAQLYVHLPFCQTICTFCPIHKEKLSSSTRVDTYVGSVKAELRALSELPYISSLGFSSVYFGGGTPSLLPDHLLAEIMEVITNSFKLAPGAQLTFEGHVHSLSRKKLAFARSIGFSRVSTGIQTFDPVLRNALNLRPTEADIRRCVESARDVGFDDFNIDLMYNLPGQSHDILLRDLSLAAELAPSGMDLYETVISQRTPLDRQLKTKQLNFDENPWQRARSYSIAEEYLAAAGYQQKNLFVWDRPGFDNRVVGSQGKLRDGELDLVGAGLAAYSVIDGASFVNETDRSRYQELVRSTGHGLRYWHRPSPTERQERFMIMSLQDFVLDREVFKREFQIDMDRVFSPQIQSFQERGLIESVPIGYRLTRAGRAWAATMAIEFFGQAVMADMLLARTEGRSFWPITREEEFDTPLFALWHPELVFRDRRDLSLLLPYAKALRAVNGDWVRMLWRLAVETTMRSGAPNFRWYARRLAGHVAQYAVSLCRPNRWCIGRRTRRARGSINVDRSLDVVEPRQRVDR